jgi:hypothetical protein
VKGGEVAARATACVLLQLVQVQRQVSAVLTAAALSSY